MEIRDLRGRSVLRGFLVLSMVVGLILASPTGGGGTLPFGEFAIESHSQGPMALFTPTASHLTSLREELSEKTPGMESTVHRLILSLLLATEDVDRMVPEGLVSEVRALAGEADYRDMPCEDILSLVELYTHFHPYDRGLVSEIMEAVGVVVERYGHEGGGVMDDGGIGIALSGKAVYLILSVPEVYDRFSAFVEGTLNLILEKGLSPYGGFHHIYLVGEDRALGDGELGDNVWAGLSLLRGYETTRREEYLDGARKAGDFIVRNLYDTKLGGFMKRNSSSPRFFRDEPGFVPEKPFYENSLALLFMVELARYDDGYREVVDPTIGFLSGEARYVEPVGGEYLLVAYRERLAMDEADRVSTGGGIEFDFKSPDEEALKPDSGLAVLIFLSFVAGLLSFLSPCTLPILPAYFAFTFQGDRKKVVVMSFAFFLGLATVFTLMGATASFVGSFIRAHLDIINIVGGTIIILFGIASMVGRGFEGVRFSFKPASTFTGSFIFGSSIAIGWTSCVGPILASILIMASTEETVTSAMVLLFVYAMGLGLPLIIISAIFKNLDKNGRFWQFIRGKGREFRIGKTTLHIHTNNIIAGLVVVLLGVLVMTGNLSHLNRILPAEIQNWLSGIEDRLLHIFM